MTSLQECIGHVTKQVTPVEWNNGTQKNCVLGTRVSCVPAFCSSGVLGSFFCSWF